MNRLRTPARGLLRGQTPSREQRASRSRAIDRANVEDLSNTLKGVGKVYIQAVLDCFSLFVSAWLCTSKMPVTAVQTLNNRAQPFFEAHSARVRTILSANRPRHEGRDALHRLQGRDPEEAPGPEAASQKGSQDTSVDLTSATEGVR